jgi:starvation-inducible outer membrane lipoprotein
MKKIIVIIAMMAMAFGCQQNNSTATLAPGVHKGIALEKINTSQYTYLLINENGVETWLAFPLAEVKIGDTYYYANEMLMNNFVSKELSRTFEKVYFIPGIFTEPPTNKDNENPQPLEQGNPQPVQQINAQPQMLQNNNAAAANTNKGSHHGMALEKINTTQYTYLKMNENGTETWLAFPLAEVKIGETYFYANEMLMTNFESKELKRIFEKVYFVSGVTTKSPLPTSAAKQGNSVTVPEKINTKIAPAPNGLTVADLFEKKESLAGKKVLVKGKVVKFSAEIMGRNWIHIQDGTFYKGSFDLTITSQQTVNIGDIITLEGILVLNKDFGSGYKYDVLIENAIVK